MTARLAALIPTRNRTALAINAVRTLLEQDCAVEIFVSDNSTAPDDALRDFVEERQSCLSSSTGQAGLPVLHYLRPERELNVAEHWDWAFRQCLERSTATHVVLQHDRRWNLPRTWGALQATASRWPESLITFGTDSITNVPPPLRIWQTPWSGKTFRIRSARAASLVAQARVPEAAHALPMLAMCAVPRTVLQSVADRFGDICRSTTPDTAFMVRFLALHDDYLHFDRPTGILYAPHRSTNAGYLRGSGGGFPDFRKLRGDGPWLEAAPVPGVDLGCNMLYHEYELVRRETGDRLPPLDREACLREMAAALRWVEDPSRRAGLAHVLGVQPPTPGPSMSWRERVHQQRTLIEARFGVAPPAITGFAFRDDTTALRYALKYPRARQESHAHLDLLEPVEVQTA